MLGNIAVLILKLKESILKIITITFRFKTYQRIFALRILEITIHISVFLIQGQAPTNKYIISIFYKI
jgi:hypothetical protein